MLRKSIQKLKVLTNFRDGMCFRTSTTSIHWNNLREEVVHQRSICGVPGQYAINRLKFLRGSVSSTKTGGARHDNELTFF